MRTAEVLLFAAGAAAAAAATCDVRTFGAKGDNVTEDTAALQAAIDACSPGTVLLPPPGRYLSRPLNFSGRNGVAFLIEPGAELIAWPNVTTWNESGPFWPFLYTDGHETLTDVTISGGGTIDGQGWRWWPFLKTRPRPNLVSMVNVDRFELSNLTLRDSPEWNTNLRGSNILVQGMTVLTNVNECGGYMSAPNTDGFNIGGVNITILDSYVHNGDDCIPTFSWNGSDTYNVYVRNVSCNCGTNGGVVILGDEKCDTGNANIHDVVFSNMTVTGTNQGAGMKMCEPGQQPTSAAWNITWRDIVIVRPRNAGMYIDVFNEDANPPCTPTVDPPVPNSMTGRNFSFVNVTGIVDAPAVPGCFLCNTGEPCEGMVFDNVQVRNSAGGAPSNYSCFNTQAIAEGTSFPAPCGV